jgi:hypothetical protein
LSYNTSNGLLHIISHTDLDGVTAAALAWRVHHDGGIPIRVSLTGYGEVDNLILETRRSGVRSIVLDLSPQFQATVDEIDASFTPEERPFLFDHHESTFVKFSNRPWIIVDTGYCGASVYWNWLHSGNSSDDAIRRVEPFREIVRIANDRDLWINEDPDGRLWQAMVTLCGEWGAFARLIANPDASFTSSERSAVIDFVARQEARFERAREHLVMSRIGGQDGPGEMAFLGDGHLEFGDTSDFCGMILDRPEDAKRAPALVALAYKKPGGSWAVSLRSREGLAGRVVSLLKDGRRIRGGGHGDAAALYFPSNYSESGIKDSILAALAAQKESASGMGVTLGDLFKGAL